MDDSLFGKRNKKGDWAPTAALRGPGLWCWPPRPAALAGWFTGFLWPWNAFFLLVSLAGWFWVLPPQADMAAPAAGWIARVLIWNWVGLLLFYGFFEWQLYGRRSQAQRFKYNGKFPREQPSEVFWFRTQNLDNFLRSFLISVPIGTAIEVVLLWMYASGRLPTLTWEQHGLQIALLVAAASFIHEIHFFVIHRIIHLEPLYRWVHAIHHNSVNPSPWSSMSMHPVEGTAYFGVALWLLLMPGHPFLALHFFTIAAFGAIVGHIGFDRIELPGGASVTSHAYAHYLHHKHFEVNYCDNGNVPLDLWFGSWHDGSPAGEQRMQARHQAKVARLNAPQ
jgi:sterol desaturase/sphingolipid hydroxylase (fatty acid hydroxylase superfamily)